MEFCEKENTIMCKGGLDKIDSAPDNKDHKQDIKSPAIDNKDAAPARKNPSTDEKDPAPELESIVDIKKIYVKGKMENTDIILSIIELCSFPKKYNYEYSNTTRNFWKTAVTANYFKQIFKPYKSETLRKLWRYIRNSQNVNEYVKIVKTNIDIINAPALPISIATQDISSYILTKETKSLQDYFIEKKLI